VRDDIFDAIHVLDDGEVEAPILRDSRLPKIALFVILLRVKGWVAEIPDEETHLFENAFRTAAGASSIASSARLL
jgi:hypothetical protein